MIKGHATKEGTFGYLKKFPKYSKDFYSYEGDFFLSSLGLGTFKSEPYKEDNYIINFKDAIKMALLNGVNLIDTAINYRFQISEREVAEALSELIDEGSIDRSEIVISSKAGFIPLDFPFPENPYHWIDENIVQKGLAFKEEVVADQHCMSPGFLRWSVEQSLKNMEIDTLDILFLHNPEMQLGLDEGYISYELLKSRIKEAFTLFETLVDEGKIQQYGIASWNAFLNEEGHPEYVSLKDMMDIAQEVGGENHHFKYLQVPYNLAKSHAYHYSNQQGPDGKYYTLFQAAMGYGLKVMGSSSLLQMNLFKAPFESHVAQTLGTTDLTDLHTALQFSRSAPVVSALFGAVDPEHVENNLLLSYAPKAKPIDINHLLQSDMNAV